MIKINPLIKNIAPDDLRQVCSFTTRNDRLGELTTSTRIYNDGFNRLITEIRNPMGKRLGHEIFSIDKEHQTMYGFYIEVEPEYRSSYMKGYRFGEIMRLSSIITMLENNIRQFDILSKNTAVYFHSRYKFIPNIIGFDDRNNMLKSIVQNGGDFVIDLTKRAIELLERISKNPQATEQRAMVGETNTIAKDYIARVLEKHEEKKHPFIGTVDMQLTAENITENRDFFNTLFQRHGIDYLIK